MRGRAGLRREDVSDYSFLVDYETYAACKQTECFLDPVCLPHLIIHIAKQYERQVVLSSEISMRVLAVGAYPNNLCPKILE